MDGYFLIKGILNDRNFEVDLGDEGAEDWKKMTR